MLPEFPFAYDEYDMPMNTRALATECPIEVSPLYRQELDEKSAILASNHRYYCQASEATEAMQWEAITHLLPVLARHYPEHFSLDAEGEVRHWRNRLLGAEARLRLGEVESLPARDHLGSPLPDPVSRPLDWLARQVQEDLILMSGDPEAGTPMVAGHLCFGGSWRLDDKMGKSFLAIHDDVPQFHARIGRPADLVMRRLKAERPIGRVNWSIATSSRRNMAPRFAYLALPTRRGITSENAGERCFLRLERQTLSRLPRTGGILFTIHTTITPLSDVVADPERLRRLTNVIKGIPRPTREYKGMAGYIDALVDYLEGRCRQASGSPATTAAKLNRTGGAELDRGSQPEAHVQGDGWEPWPLDPENVLEGDPRARVRWVRRSGYSEPWHQAGWLELEPSVTRMLCDGLQTFLIEEGELTISGEDGVPRRLGAGEAFVPERDSVNLWAVSAPLRCFFSYSK
ncbi:MAG TPA: heme-dependent oxidative N-demethylase subunit alpha family protein [Chloroflexota bacterium]|nr:heme-dependent oxidative N-demethylase subunit alpha family protein [Chloroflexota bacterium]